MRRGRRARATTGTLRVDARTARLTPRLQRGDIAVLDHVDLDGATAQVLLSRGVVGVVNAAPSSSGRFPNLGPALLVEAGVPLLDDVGAGVLTALREGDRAVIDGDTLLVGDTAVVRGMRQDPESVAQTHDHARAGLAAQLADLAGGAVGLVADERALLLDGVGLPDLRTPLAGRHVLVVGPAYGAASELGALRAFRRRFDPVLVGVDGGGDLLLRAGLVPHVLVGDPETMSDAVLQAAGEVVLRAGSDSWDRVHDLAVPAHAVTSRVAAEDLALLLCRRECAALVVTAGLPRSLEELVDRGRAAASTVLVRAALGASVVPAQAAARLTPRRRRGLPLLCALLAAGLAASVAVGQQPLVDRTSDAVSHAWHDLTR